MISYKDSIKQLIYHGQGIMLHRNKGEMFEMSGKMYRNPPKVLRYIVENRVEIGEVEE